MAGEFRLGGVVPWGRSAAEYERFFALGASDGPIRILDCGGGPASFAAEWGATGHFAVAVDPLYALPNAEIVDAFEPVAERMLEGMRSARDRFDWTDYGSPEAVVERRGATLRRFALDRSRASSDGRYVAGRLPELPFASDAFDLVLCSHLLFLYSNDIGQDDHLAALREMLRVGREVRVFPLADLNGERSSHLDPVVEVLRREAVCEIVHVPFEFQHGASFMLSLRLR
ncbi:MAG: methyltransferase domain-containing protein [Gemmatimonas sp.]|nr:methyltransferase domain-containing protein [Gemmatimonas sp.]